MTTRKAVDSWDDDWTGTNTAPIQPVQPVKLSQRERRLKQAEFNKQLWADAEAEPYRPFVVESRNAVPLQSSLKPAVKVLSRKPQARKDGDLSNEIDKLGLDDDEEDVDEFGNPKPKQLTLEERQAKAAAEREEKQRKYDEVRQRLFGESTAGKSGTASASKSSSPSRKGQGQGQGQVRDDKRVQAPLTRSAGSQKQLYDPAEARRPESMARSEGRNAADQFIVRQPRGPDGPGFQANQFTQPPKPGYVA